MGRRSRKRTARAVEAISTRTVVYVVVALVVGFAGDIGYALAFVDGGGEAAPASVATSAPEPAPSLSSSCAGIA